METTRFAIMLAAIGLYLCTMLWIGIRTRKWVSDMGDFLVAGREISTVLLAFGLFSLVAAGTTFAGATGLGYTDGMAGGIWGLSWALAALIAGVVFAPICRATGGYTLAEWIGMRYGTASQAFIAIPQVLGAILSGAAQIVGSAFIICGLTGCSYTTAVLVSGVVVLVYTLLGGLWAVVYTEFVQTVFCIAAVVIPVAFLMHTYGGFDFLVSQLPQTYFYYPGSLGWGPPEGNWALLTGLGCFWGFFMIVIPNTYIWTQTASSRSTKTASWAFWLAAALCIIFMTWLIALIGMYGKAAGIEVANSQMIFGAVIKRLPLGLDALVLIGILSAIMSTASGAAIGASASALRDLYQAPFRPEATVGELIGPTRVLTVICWAIIIILAFALEKIGTLQALGLSFAYFSITLPVFIATFFFPSVKKEEVSIAVVLAFIITTTYVLSQQWLKPPYFVHPIWIGPVVCTFFLIAVKLLFKAVGYRPKEKAEAEPEENDVARVLDLILKGRNEMVYLIDALGREGKYVGRIVEKLIKEGLVEREGARGLKYQRLRVKDAAKARYRYVNNEEIELIDENRISWEDLLLLGKIVKATDEKGRAVSLEEKEAVEQLLGGTNKNLAQLKNTVLFLNSRGLLDLQGIFRLKFKANDEAKQLLRKYQAALEGER